MIQPNPPSHTSKDRAPPGVGPLSAYKEFGPTSYAVRHKTSVMVLFVFLTVAGLLTYRAIPRESFPAIEVPRIAVNTIYPGVSPSDIETLITRELEDELSTISEIKELTSTSVEGFSSIVAEFETSVNLDEALQKVREQVDLARPDLPEEAEEPAIVEFDFSEIPILQVNLSGGYGLVRLKELAEDIQDRVEQLPSVLRADLRGGLEREVQVNVDLSRLQFYSIEIQDVIDAIRDENVNIPGGSIDVGQYKYLVRVDGEFDDPAVIEDLVVSAEDGRPIYVRDVATVDFGFAERESYARLDGAPVVTLDIIKRSGQNIIESVDAVKAVLEEMAPLFPPSTVVKLTSDQSKRIDRMVGSLENNIVSGLILIVAVLLFFLGTSNSFFVAVSIPTSMLLSFIILGVTGISLNMVVLFSLILALGMLVDNAIVIVENIYRYLEEGWDRETAARKATGEVAMPVIAATLTTLAAFTPLLFWPGETGEFMKYLPATLIIALSSSLFVAMIIIPTLCAMYMRLEDEPGPGLKPALRWSFLAAGVVAFVLIGRANILTSVLLSLTLAGLYLLHRFVLKRVAQHFQFTILPANLRFYERVLRQALAHRWASMGGATLVLITAFVVFRIADVGVEYFPEDMPPEDILVDIELPVGSRADATNRIALLLEREIVATPGAEDVESTVATVGASSGGGGGNPRAGGASGPDASRVTVSLIDFQDRSFDAFELLRRMQATLGGGIAGAEVRVDQAQQGPASGAPVNLEIIGEDPIVLKRLSDEVLSILENDAVYGKLVGLESDLDEARAELAVTIDREKAALYGVSSRDVGMAIRGAIQGIEAGKYRTGEDEYDIVVRLDVKDRRNLEDLRDLTVMADGTPIPLLSVASWQVEDGAGSIQRKDQTRMATISSDVRAGLNQNGVLGEVQEVLSDFVATQLPVGYEMRYTGQNQDQSEAASFLQGAFLAALMLIALILVTQFNSVVKPVIILTSVLLSTAGVLFGLVIFDMPFGIIMTGVGVISLAGIVVNNAIVLIDYVDILRTRDGLTRNDALIRGGIVRFRPVVLTALTTALGLVPLAVGLNFDFFGLYTNLDPDLFWGGEQAAWWGPMAVAVIAGILFATVLTLVLVPVMYSLIEDMIDFFRRVFTNVDGIGSDSGSTVEEGEDQSATVGAPMPGGEPTTSPQPAGAGA